MFKTESTDVKTTYCIKERIDFFLSLQGKDFHFKIVAYWP